MTKPFSNLVVAGVDLFDEFGVAVTDGFELSPPSPVTRYVDIPGRNGPLDLTEALGGDACFSTRLMRFELLWVGDGLRGFEAAKTRLSNFLHGRRLPFEWTRDPGYTYTGRFSVDSYAGSLHFGTVVMQAECDPYKMRPTRRLSLAAGGGSWFVLPCGRMPVCPVFECLRETEVRGEGMAPVLLQAGTWRVRGLVLRQGDNRVWANSAVRERGDSPVSSWPEPVSASDPKTMAELTWTKVRTGDAYGVTVTYEWGDL